MKKLLIFVLSVIAFNAMAQSPILEKTYDLPPEAKNGWIGSLEVNNEKQTIDMIHITSGQYEIYTYDKDLNLLKTDKGNDPQKLKSSKNDHSDSYSIASSSNGMKGQLQICTKDVAQIEHVFPSKLGAAFTRELGEGAEYRNYDKRGVRFGNKTEVKQSDGQNYMFKGGAYEIRTTHTLLVLAEKTKEKDHAYPFKNYTILSFDNQTNMKVTETVEFNYCNVPIFSAPLKDEQVNLSNDAFPRDWIVVFAPVEKDGKMRSLDKEIKDPKPTNYTYIRISPEGKVVERVSFDSPSNGWRISGADEINGSVYLYGSAMTDDPSKNYIDNVFNSYMSETMIPVDARSGLEERDGYDMSNKSQEALNLLLDAFKYSHYQIGKITNGKPDFVNATSFEDLEKKQIKPASQKKTVFNEGEKFITTGIYISKSGEIFITGYNFDNRWKRKNFGGGASGNEDSPRTCKGVFVFQFDAQGTLVKNYGVDLKLKDQALTMKGKYYNEGGLEAGDKGFVPERFMPESFLSESEDGKTLNWTIRSCHDVYGEGISNKATYGYGYIGINKSTAELSEYTILDKTSYCLLKYLSWWITDDYYMENFLGFKVGKAGFLSSWKCNSGCKHYSHGLITGYKLTDKTDYVQFNNSKTCMMGNSLYVFNMNHIGSKIIINKMDISK